MQTERAGSVSRVILALGLSVAGCGSTTGPSLDVSTDQTALASTLGNSQLCCCHVTGVVVNRSTVGVHVTLTYEAYARNREGVEEKIGTALAFVKDLRPAERRAFTAVGFVVPCASIERRELVDLDVRAIWEAPS
jgi:hypothetical protein